LILALASGALACGDDDGGGKPSTDAGGGTGGSGGSGGGSAVEACVADADEVTMGMTSDACLTCACTEGADEVEACDATCWALIDCFGSPAKCGDVDTADMAAAITCITSSCPAVDLAMAAASSEPATALGTVLSSSCSSQCASTAAPDGGAGSGGSGGAGGAGGAGGSDADGGDADGG
jgi:hypothetical protein